MEIILFESSSSANVQSIGLAGTAAIREGVGKIEAKSSFDSKDRAIKLRILNKSGDAEVIVFVDGSVECRGNPLAGGDPRQKRSQLFSVKSVVATLSAFAALRVDGRVVTWGDCRFGGDPGLKQHFLFNITDLTATNYAFAALRQNGDVVCWGLPQSGGDAGSKQKKLTNVVSIVATHRAFSAIRKYGFVTAWGCPSHGGAPGNKQSDLFGVKFVASNDCAFAAVRSDGQVVVWGSSDSGGEFEAGEIIQNELFNVHRIGAFNRAFAVEREDGCVISWGAAEDYELAQASLQQVHGLISLSREVKGILQELREKISSDSAYTKAALLRLGADSSAELPLHHTLLPYLLRLDLNLFRAKPPTRNKAFREICRLIPYAKKNHAHLTCLVERFSEHIIDAIDPKSNIDKLKLQWYLQTVAKERHHLRKRTHRKITKKLENAPLISSYRRGSPILANDIYEIGICCNKYAKLQRMSGVEITDESSRDEIFCQLALIFPKECRVTLARIRELWESQRKRIEGENDISNFGKPIIESKSVDVSDLVSLLGCFHKNEEDISNKPVPSYLFRMQRSEDHIQQNETSSVNVSDIAGLFDCLQSKREGIEPF